MSEKEYAHACDEESTSWERGYPSREDAITGGEVDYDGDGFVTGVIAPVEPETFFRLDIADFLEECAQAANDEFAGMDGPEDDWADALRFIARKEGGETFRDLERRLETAFGDWCRAHDLDTKFFFVQDIQGHPGKEQE